MSAQSILEQIGNLGLSVSIEEDRLAVRPKERLTPELRQAIREHKAEILRLLQAETTTSYREGPPYPDDLGRVKCEYCEHCEMVEMRPGIKAACTVSRKPMWGIALLRECEHFKMTATRAEA